MTTLTLNGATITDFVEIKGVDEVVQQTPFSNEDFLKTIFKETTTSFSNAINSIVKNNIKKFNLSKSQVKSFDDFIKNNDIKITFKYGNKNERITTNRNDN